jgi:3'-5' exonuclease
MANGDDFNKGTGSPSGPPAFLVLDTESVPDGKLLARIKYAAENLSPEEAVCKAQAEAREASNKGSDFLPVTYHVPVAVCVLRVGEDFGLQTVTCLDGPLFRPREIVKQFWTGINRYPAPKTKLVTFNGRGFDMPMMELAAFRYGCSGRDYFHNSRYRFGPNHLDICDWLSNFGAARMTGGLNLLSKILGKPGKMDVAGDRVYQMHREGKLQEINDYCVCDTLDTYFVFLRTRVLTGDLTLEREHELVAQAKAWITAKVAEVPALQQYLNNWGDWDPWP